MKKISILVTALLAVLLVFAGCTQGGNNSVTYVEDLDKYVTLGEYKGLEYVAESTEVTDEEIESEMNYFIQGLATVEQIMEGTVKDGDTVNIDFVGKKDGVAFDGGTAQATDLTIGSGMFIPGFEEQLIGMVPGETRSIDVTFPEDYHSTELAGAAVVFDVTANYICGDTIVPELTDELVAENTEYATVEEFRTTIAEELKGYKEQSAKESMTQELWQQVMDNCTFHELPADKVQEEKDSTYLFYEEYAGYYGLELEDFLEQMGMTPEQFEEELNVYAEDIVKRNLAGYAIVEKENITVSDKEYTEYLAGLAPEYGYESAEAMEETVGREAIVEDMLWTKIYDLILANTK